MSRDAEVLSRLAQIDGRIFALQEELESQPRQLQMEQKALDDAKAAVEELRGQLKELQKLVDQRELAMRTAEQDAIKLEGQLPSLKTNEDYQKMLKQIEAKKDSIGGHEDKILQAMEVLDTARGGIPEREANVKVREEQLEKKRAVVAEESKGKEAEIETLKAEWKTVLTELSAPMADAYQKRRERLKQRATALVDGAGHCGGCRTKLTAQQEATVLGGDVLICPHCQRLLRGAS